MISFKTFISEGLATLDDHVRFYEAGMPLPDKKEVYIDQAGHRAYYENPEGGSSIHLIGRLGAANRKHYYTTRFDHLKNETVHRFGFVDGVNEDLRLDYDLEHTHHDHSLLDLHMNTRGYKIPDRPLTSAILRPKSYNSAYKVHYEDVGTHELDEKLPKHIAKNIKDMMSNNRIIQKIHNTYSTDNGARTYIHFLDGHRTPYVSVHVHDQKE